MDINGRKIYPDRDAEGIDYEPSEWRLCEGMGHLICHMPTWSIFQIECDEGALKSGATIFDFSARIVHVCDPQYRPSDAALEFIARGAIAAYLQAIGAWKPVVVDFPDTPEQKAIKSRYPKPS